MRINLVARHELFTAPQPNLMNSQQIGGGHDA